MKFLILKIFRGPECRESDEIGDISRRDFVRVCQTIETSKYCENFSLQLRTFRVWKSSVEIFGPEIFPTFSSGIFSMEKFPTFSWKITSPPPSIIESVTTTPLRELSCAICIARFLHTTHVFARPRRRIGLLQYCACHNPGAALTRRFRLSFSPRSPAIWTSRGNATVGIGQFAGALKSYVRTHAAAAILADAIPRPAR